MVSPSFHKESNSEGFSKSKHLIGRLDFNVKQKYPKLPQQSTQPRIIWGDKTLSDFMRHKILPMVERVFDDVLAFYQVDGDEKIVIDRLEVDLSLYDYPYINDLLPQELYKKLKSAIEKYLCLSKNKHDTEDFSAHNFDKVLCHVFDDKNVRKIIELWPYLFESNRGSLSLWCAQYLKKSAYQRFVAQRFPLNIIYDIVYLLDNENADFIISVIKQCSNINVEPLSKKYDHEVEEKSEFETEKKSIYFSNDPAIERSQTIEFSLVYLTCERGGSFNKKSYMRSLLRQLAAHYNQNLHQLCQHLQLSIQNAALSKNIKQALLEIIDDEAVAIKRSHIYRSQSAEINFERGVEDIRKKRGKLTPWMQDLLAHGWYKQSYLWRKFMSLLARQPDLLHCLVNGSTQNQQVLLLSSAQRYYQLRYYLGHGVQSSKTVSVVDRARERLLPKVYVIKLIKILLGYNKADNNDIILENDVYKVAGLPLVLQKFLSDLKNFFVLLPLNNLKGKSDREYFAFYIREFLNKNPAGLKEILLSSSNDIFIKTLCKFLPESLLHRLSYLLGPSLYHSLNRYSMLLQSIVHDSQLLKNSSVQSCIYWQVCLSYIVSHATRQSPTTVFGDFIQQLVRALAYETGLTIHHVQSHLLHCVQVQLNQPQFLPSSTISAGLSDVASAIHHLLGNDHAKALQDDYLSSLRLFERSLLGKPWCLQDKQWQRLIQHCKPQLRYLLIKHLQSSHQQYFFLNIIPESIQKTLLLTIDSQAEGIVRLIWSGNSGKGSGIAIKVAEKLLLAKFGGAASVSQFSLLENYPQGGIALLLKNFVVTYLVSERGSEFNRRSFARSLLRQLSAHYNMDYLAVVALLQGGLEGQGIPPSIKKYFIDVVGESSFYNQEFNGVQKSVFSLIEKGAELYDRLRDYLQQGLDVNEQIMASLLEKMHRYYPHYLQRIIREWQSGVLYFYKLEPKNKNYPLKNWMHLLKAVLSILGHVNLNDGDGIFTAIQRYAKKSVNPYYYFYYAIKTLISGDVIDLEKINADVKRLSLNDCLKHDVNYISQGDKENKSTPVNFSIQNNSQYSSIVKKLYFINKGGNPEILYFFSLSEAEKLAVFTRVDNKKTQKLLPVLESLKQAVMGSQLLAGEDINVWFYKTLSEQFVHPDLKANIDRLIQTAITNLLVLSDKHKASASLYECQQKIMQHLSSDLLITKNILGHHSEDIYKYYSWVSDQQRSALVSLSLKDVGLSVEVDQDNSGGIFEGDINEEFNNAFVDKVGVSISYAGIVILAPYISMLFEKLQLLTVDKQSFIDDQHRQKALSALCFLALGDGLNELITTPDLVLPNILCGNNANELLASLPRLSEDEREVCNSLLNGVIQHWSALGNTRIEGLRETFLQRSGFIRYEEDKGWQLKIDTQPFDVLLDRLPWSYKLIKYQFMTEVLHVEWRES